MPHRGRDEGASTLRLVAHVPGQADLSPEGVFQVRLGKQNRLPAVFGRAHGPTECAESGQILSGKADANDPTRHDGFGLVRRGRPATKGG